MHIIAGIIGLGAVLYIYTLRARRGAEMAGDLLDMGREVKAAARRFGFRRQTNVHPVETIDDPALAIAGLAQAFAGLDDLPTAEQRGAVTTALQRHLRLDREAAKEAAILGQWFIETCNGAAPAVPRLARKLRTLDHGASFDSLMNVLRDVIAAGPGQAASKRQTEALGDLAQVFRLYS